MANKDYARGLQPAGPVLGSHRYTLSSGYAQNLFIGDPVVATTNANNVLIATPASPNKILGSILAVYDADMVPMNYWDSGHSGVGYVLVADNPDQVFVCQGDGASSYLDANDSNGNISLVSGAGSTVNYRSGWELDDSQTAGSGATEQIRLIRPVDRPDNTVASANCDWLCKINNHQAAAGVVGAGI